MYKKTILLIVSFVFSLVVILLSIELFYRYIHPSETFSTMRQYSWMKEKHYYENYFKNSFTLDPIFGFRPILGSAQYNKFGTMINEYEDKKKESVYRILFIGDSVTQHGNIIEGLRQFYGDDRYEYWNAGVGSYNTKQEVDYYKAYNYAISPDEVILTFVYNDFDITPIAFFNSPDDLVVYSPNKQIHNLSPFLFKNSYIYRKIISYQMSKNTALYWDNAEVESSLKTLRDELITQNIKLTVVISPLIKSSNELTPYDNQLHMAIVQILHTLGIRYFDLTNTDIIDSAINNNIPLNDPIENDIIHPSRELGLLFGKYLYDNNIFPKKY